MANTALSGTVYTIKTFVRITDVKRETIGQVRKNTSDNVYCTSIKKALQQTRNFSSVWGACRGQ